MSPREETEEEVRPPEMSLCGPHETKAQRVPLKKEDFSPSSVSFKSDELKVSIDVKERQSSLSTPLQNALDRLKVVRSHRPLPVTVSSEKKEVGEGDLSSLQTVIQRLPEKSSLFTQHIGRPRSGMLPPDFKGSSPLSMDSDDSNTSSVSVKSDQSKGHNIDFKESSSLRAAFYSSSEEDEFSESIKSDQSKDSVDVNERRSSLKVPFKGKNHRSEVDTSEEKRQSRRTRSIPRHPDF